MITSAGFRFRAALGQEKPLQVAGCINAYSALLAERIGFRALYLSGGGVSAASLGLPDLGISTLDDVLTDVRRITDATNLPLLVDADTGFGASAFNIARTVKSLIKSGAGAMHIEDQVQAKRCGHRPGKMLVSESEMVDRIRAAVDARADPDFVLMARTDALADGRIAIRHRPRVRICRGGRGHGFSRSGGGTHMYGRLPRQRRYPFLPTSPSSARPLFIPSRNWQG